MLEEAGVMRSACFVSNVVNAMPPYGDLSRWVTKKKKDITPSMVRMRDLYVEPVVRQGFEALLREIDLVKPNIIVAFGSVALWALTGASGIMKWRGSQLHMEVPWEMWPRDLQRPLEKAPRPKLIPVLHPAAILREWSARQTAVFDLKRVAKEVHTKEYGNAPDWKFKVRPTFAEVSATLDALRTKLDNGDIQWIDFDLETRAGHIACAGISWSLTEALCIPLMCVEDRQGYWTAEMEGAIVYDLYKILTHPKVKVRGQNLLYDAQYTYRHWHFVPRVAQDTMISFHSTFCGLRKSLDFQASLLCDHYLFWKDDGKTWSENMSEDQLWTYNCVDCVRTREVGEASQRNVEALGLQSVDAFQQKMFWPVLQCMQRGIAVDKKHKANLALELQEAMVDREEFFKRILGHALNPRSRTQMIKLFYEDLKQPIVWGKPKKGKPRTPTLGKEALAIIERREPLLRPLVNGIREYRSLGVFLKTFALAALDVDGRMRTSYNITGTKTFRLASRKNAFGSGANLANLPKGDEAEEGEEEENGEEVEEGEEVYSNLSNLHLPNIRKMYVPDPGYTIFDTDQSKADLRIVQRESGELELKAMLDEGRDPYVETAREYYRDPTITKKRSDGSEHPQYKTFKSFAHGTHYLGTPQGLAQRLSLTVHEASRAQKWYLERYPKIRKWQEDFKKQLASKRFVENIFGYRRYYFDRIDEKIFREGIAWKPQSTVAILTNKIWMNIYENYPHIQILLQNHDSLVGQYPSFRGDEAKRQIAEASQIVLPYDDPLIIPVGIATSEKSWGDCR